MKRAFFVVLLIFLALNVNSLTISNYNVPSEVPLGQILTIDGQINPAQEKVLCSIRIYDLDTNNLTKRLTDEYTTAGGVFSSSYLTLNEPPFFRTSDYNVVTDCNGAISNSTFTVAQKLGFTNLLLGEIFFIKDNGPIIIIGGVFLLIILVFVAWFWAQYQSPFR